MATTTTKIAYAAAASITCDIASKTSTQGQRSAVIDNSSNLYDDALVLVSVKIGTFTAGGYIAVYAYASADDGTTYETGGSTNAAYNTINGGEKLLGVIIPTSSTTTNTGVFTVAQAYGGVMPRNWGIIIWQSNCGTLSSTESDHTKKYQGVTYTQS